MDFPDTITITRKSGGTVDSEFGIPTPGTETTTTVYSGPCFVQGDEEHRAIDSNGNLVEVTRPKVYLPAGTYTIQRDDVAAVSTGHNGIVHGIKHFTSRFYTKLVLKWSEARS